MHRKNRGFREDAARNEEGFEDKDEEEARAENEREARAAMKFYIKELDLEKVS